MILFATAVCGSVYGLYIIAAPEPGPDASFNSAVLWAAREGIRVRRAECKAASREGWYSCTLASGNYAYLLECNPDGCRPLSGLEIDTVPDD